MNIKVLAVITVGICGIVGFMGNYFWTRLHCGGIQTDVDKNA